MLSRLWLSTCHRKGVLLQGGYLLWRNNKNLFWVRIELVDLVNQTLVFGLSPILSSAHTALAPTIGIGSLEWMDTSYVYCIRNCINLEMYSSICINLCYAVWSTVWLLIHISSVVFSLFLIFISKAKGRRRHWVICHSSKDTHWIQVNI
jgi:hypothetical protein